MKHWLISIVAAAVLAGCQPQPETLVTGGYDPQEMEQAIETARSKVDVFLAELASPTGTDHAVKAAVEDDGQTEHFWLTGVVYKNGAFTGRISNQPGVINSVAFGQLWTVSKEEVSDWKFMKDGKIHGNYTMRPLLKTLSKEEAARYRKMLAEP